MSRTNPDPVAVAVMAKAPIPGRTKTRLIPDIGAHAAAILAERMIERAVQTAINAAVGPVTLWCAPDPAHASFHGFARHYAISLATQPEGDLGARMLACMKSGPSLVVGSDCPALDAARLREAARALRDFEVVLIPAEDGGYVLIGTRVPQPGLFDDITWSTDTVLAETLRRIAALNLRAIELAPLWDVDTEGDLARLERELPDLAL